MKKAIAEFIGTFVLVFFGTGSIIMNDLYGGLGGSGIALSFGLSVTIVIYFFGRVSGAHINPAVSLSFLILNKLDLKHLFNYTIVQIIGAVLASLTLKFLFPDHLKLGITEGTINWQSTFLLELLLTFILVLIILIFSQNKKLSRFTALAVGATVGLEAFLAGPLTGASMNPARSFGPSIVSGITNQLWIYLIATYLGSIIASYFWRVIQRKPVLN